MKRFFTGIFIILSSLNANATVNANATNFDGLYVGILSQYVHRNQTCDLNVNVLSHGINYTLNNTEKRETNSDSFDYGIMGGYGNVLQDSNLYIGTEVNLRQDSANKDELYLLNIYPPYYKNTVQVTCKYNRGPVLGIAPQFGLVFADSYMVFIKPGIEVSRDRVETQIEGESKEITSRKTKFVFVPGIGITKSINKNFLLTLGYEYNSGNNIRNGNNLNDPMQGMCSVKYTAHAIKVSAAYRF